MLTSFREKFGKIMVFGIVGLLALVFVFYGVVTPKSGRISGGGEAGEVNGDPIPLSEFNRAYNRQLEYFKNLMGGAHLSDEQLKNFRIKESVFGELVRRRVMIQQAEKLGYVPSDDEVRDRIAEQTVFQVNGKFDLERYKGILAQNDYTPAGYEKAIRDDMAAEKWQDFFRNRVNVSESEIRQQFLASADKRDIKYVLLNTETGKKDVQIPAADVSKALADPAKLNLIKSQFEMKKNAIYKGKTFDAVKEEIAREILASTHLEDIRKNNEKLADKVLGVMTVQKSSDAKVDQLLKPYGVSVKSTGLIGRDNTYLPGIGEAKELMADAFAAKSPINPEEGGKVKRYSSMNWVVVAVVTETQKPDLAKLSTQATHDEVAKQLTARKERSLFDTWLEQATKKAKISTNPAVLGDDQRS